MCVIEINLKNGMFFSGLDFNRGGVQSKLLQMTLPRAILGGIFLETFLEIFMENIIFALISAKW